MSNKTKGIIIAIIGAISWGTYGTFVSLLSETGFSENSIALFCPLALIILFFAMQIAKNPKGFALNKKRLLCCIIVGVFAVFGTNLFYVKALSNGISVGIASVITFANYFIVMIASRYIWKTKITVPKICAGILALVGIFLLLEAWAGFSFAIIGLIWIIIVTLTFACGYIFCSYCVNEQGLGMDVEAYFFWTNLIGFILLLFISPPMATIQELTTVVANHGIYAIMLLLGLCLIPQLLNYYCEGKALNYISPELLSIIFAIDPIVAAILGSAVLGQSLHFIQIIGMLITVAAVVWVQVIELKESKATEEITT